MVDFNRGRQTASTAYPSQFYQVPALREAELDPSVERTHAETFDFADLRFIKSSRMSKRWLVFALRIKVGSVAECSTDTDGTTP